MVQRRRRMHRQRRVLTRRQRHAQASSGRCRLAEWLSQLLRRAVGRSGRGTQHAYAREVSWCRSARRLVADIVLRRAVSETRGADATDVECRVFRRLGLRGALVAAAGSACGGPRSAARFERDDVPVADPSASGGSRSVRLQRAAPSRIASSVSTLDAHRGQSLGLPRRQKRGSFRRCSAEKSLRSWNARQRPHHRLPDLPSTNSIVTAEQRTARAIPARRVG